MALTRIQPPALADVREPNFRNLVINGDMAVSQRGTSFASNGYTLDRFTMDESTDGAVTVTQDTDVPAGSGFASSLKVDCTTADGTIAAAQYCGFTQNIEGQNMQYLKYGTSSAESLTLSFWVKSVKTGIYCVRFVKEAGGETRYECPIEYTISSASTWEKKTIILTPTAGSTTFIQNSAGAIVNSNASGFRVFFALAVGSNFQATNNTWVAGSDKLGTSSQVNFLDSTSNNFWITGIQLESGSVATDFEVDTFAQNLERCRRYALVLGDAPGGAAYDTFFKGVIGHYYNATDFYPNFNFPIVMRSVPGTTFSTASSGFGTVYSNGSGRANTSNGTNATYETNINFRVSTASATAGDGGAFDFAASNYVILSAEL